MLAEPVCFSATASFTTAGLLLPVGVASVALCLRSGRSERLPLAIAPLAFALQQSCEGLVWLALGGGDAAAAQQAAQAYLFFAYGFWPLWIPLACLIAGSPGAPQERIGVPHLLVVLGAAMALMLGVPLLLDPAAIVPVVVRGSLHYATPALLDAGGPQVLARALYGALIGVPLLLSPSHRQRLFGLVLLLAFLAAQTFYLHAFGSVWCYFSAALSCLVLWIVAEEPRALPLRPPVPG